MDDIEKARGLLLKSGLGFPKIPTALAAQMKERGEWLFSTRPITMSPYNLQHYVHEVDQGPVEDYAVLSHSGHGVNSYAIQYYLVYGALRMFLHLNWGGIYSDAMADAAKICACFSAADQVVGTAKKAAIFDASELPTIVASDFYAPAIGARDWSDPKARFEAW
jgi:hypothetical protein